MIGKWIHKIISKNGEQESCVSNLETMYKETLLFTSINCVPSISSIYKLKHIRLCETITQFLVDYV